jgi:hypothetical protein
MSITGAAAVMEEAIETVVGHATEIQTERDRQIAEDSGPGMVTGTIAVGGTTPVTAGPVVRARPIPPAAVTAHALGLPSRMASRAKTARCALTHLNGLHVHLLTLTRNRSQLSLHRLKPRPRRRRRLSDYANSKP